LGLNRHNYAQQLWLFKFGRFRCLKFTATNNHHIDQIKNKPQDLLVILAVQPGVWPVIRAEENNNQPNFNI